MTMRRKQILGYLTLVDAYQAIPKEFSPHHLIDTARLIPKITHRLIGAGGKWGTMAARAPRLAVTSGSTTYAKFT